MLTNLLQRRIEKIFKFLLESSTIDYDILSRQERQLVEQVTRNMRTALLLEEDLFAPLDAESSTGFLLIRFLEEYPAIAGTDMKTYGPFRPDDLATLPLENARVLIRKNIAEPIIIKQQNI
jgi:DNA replication factor GINS